MNNAEQPSPAGRGVPPAVALAAMLRLTQWHLDDVAHDLPAGRTTADQRQQLAHALANLAALIRAVPDSTDGSRGLPTSGRWSMSESMLALVGSSHAFRPP